MMMMMALKVELKQKLSGYSYSYYDVVMYTQMCFLATMARYLPTDKLLVERHTQWRSVLLKLQTYNLQYF